MKFSRRFGAIAVCALALLSIAAQAAGLDVSGFVVAHRDVFAGLSMLAMSGELDPREVKQALERISAQVQEKLGPLDETVTDLKAQVLEIEQKMAKKKDGIGSPGAVDGSLDLAPLFNSPGLSAIKAKQLGAGDKTERVFLTGGIKAMVNPSPAPNSNNDVFWSAGQHLGVRGTVFRPLRLLDVLVSIPVTSYKVDFVRLNWTGGADAQLEEGDTKARMTFDSEPHEAYISTIAVLVDVSLQVLADNDLLQAQLTQIMRHNVMAKLEEQLITGSGTTGRIEGLYLQAPELDTNLDPVPERIGDALQQMETQGFTPNVVLMNPADWFKISMLKDSEGRYIYGNPSAPAQPTLFNRPVITSPSIPLEQVLIGDTAQAPVLDREQPSVAVSLENKDNFERNMATLRVELRAGLALFNTGAFRRVSLETRS